MIDKPDDKFFQLLIDYQNVVFAIIIEGVEEFSYKVKFDADQQIFTV